MATEHPETRPDQVVEEKIETLRRLFADAPEVGKKALDRVLSRLASDASSAPPPPVQSAGRIGSRLGKVSELTIIDSAWEGWPGIRSPEAKDYLAKYQVSAEGWYVANDLTVAETRRLRRIGEAVDEFLDKIGD
ncbi:hypothetical protein GCM10009630_34380 [Kribbella jejuensis]|uniref:Uncharacterized protein n=1 Tax=Kribbella jejuensis TaxID=236068 RepID=A0A542DT01_9ACTN|nr:hypothetical protein [Kribbella jejuensis]TQJ06223.1 hypothetical protein FB475_5878 [Kribbella jejuensis]